MKARSWLEGVQYITSYCSFQVVQLRSAEREGKVGIQDSKPADTIEVLGDLSRSPL